MIIWTIMRMKQIRAINDRLGTCLGCRSRRPRRQVGCQRPSQQPAEHCQEFFPLRAVHGTKPQAGPGGVDKVDCRVSSRGLVPLFYGLNYRENHEQLLVQFVQGVVF